MKPKTKEEQTQRSNNFQVFVAFAREHPEDAAAIINDLCTTARRQRAEAAVFIEALGQCV